MDVRDRGNGVSLILIPMLALLSGCPSQAPVRESLSPEHRSNMGTPSRVIAFPNEENVNTAIENLRTDDVKWNCHSAMYYLYNRRDGIRPCLVENLGIDDLQVQDAILRILCETKSFTPDERFIKLLIERIDKRGGLVSLRAHHSTHYDFISYLATHGQEFHETIANAISSENIFVQYAATYALCESGTLEKHLSDYTPEIISRIVGGLMREAGSARGNIYNVRICLMLGEKCLPELKKHASISGSGTSTLAELLVRAIEDNNREARDTIHLEYAYLESRFLAANSRYPGGIRPLSTLLIDARPNLIKE